jgi:hypothetical protein
MKRIEVKLAVHVVAPLLDVIKGMADSLRHELASPYTPGGLDEEFDTAWSGELLAAQTVDLQVLLALFNEAFFADGVIAFDEDNAEQIVRATAAVRLRLRTQHLGPLGDETLETGNVELERLDEPLRKAFMCYLFLATIQELIIQHMDGSILGA